MLHNSLNIIANSYRKALCEYRFMRNLSYPEFVYAKDCYELGNEIPVFCFHSVSIDDLQDKLYYLVKNGYRTLTANELFERLTGTGQSTSNEVVLTFDDGWRSLWEIAYPLLAKFNLKAIAFIVPTWISDTENQFHKIANEEIGESKINVENLNSYDRPAYVTWGEVLEMEKSGVIDFQSHSLNHSTVFTSSKVIDFVNPNSSNIVHKIPANTPANNNGALNPDALGMPLYTVAPRLTGAREYSDDPRIREACISFVEENGKEKFFSKRGWKKDLVRIVNAYRMTFEVHDHFETDKERYIAIRRELEESKNILEERLRKHIYHLCYPFFAGSSLALEISKHCGYKTNFWGWPAPSNPRQLLYGKEHLYGQVDITDFSCVEVQQRRTNITGNDPYKIVRLPADFIYRLPGDNRRTLSHIISKKVLKNIKMLK